MRVGKPMTILRESKCGVTYYSYIFRFDGKLITTSFDYSWIKEQIFIHTNLQVFSWKTSLAITYYVSPRMDVSPCSLCESLTLPYLKSCEPSILQKFREKVFHGPCATCDAEEDQSLRICKVCRHLRLQHLVSCSRSWAASHDWGRFSETTDNIQHVVRKLHVKNILSPEIAIEIELGTFNELKGRSNCKLCSEITELFVFRWKNKDFTEDLLDKYVVTATKTSQTKGWSIDVKLKEGNRVQIHSTIKFTSSPSFHARQTDPVTSMSRKPINWDQIEGWIEEYDSKFNNLIPEPSFVLPKQFRVIDVERDRVILAPDHCEFVALSYVWGKTTSDLMLCISNVQQLAKDFSISRIDIPATIKDAMIACAMIGKRYLWVDRLCIVQDESDDIKLAQIERMGDIYSSAFLTIVGACGNDARSGLAGIDGKPRTRAPWVISLNKTILVEDVGYPFYVESEAIPRWHTRGWTYQELVLSSRLLIFTEFGVYYMRNPKDNFNGGDEGTFEFPSNGFLSLEIYEFEARDIRSLIETYSKRHLTYDAGRIRAFSGIFNHLGIRHQSGMPWNEFDEYLFWRPCLWKQASRTLDSSKASLFPTWSWSSVAGPVQFDILPCAGNNLGSFLIGRGQFCRADST